MDDGQTQPGHERRPNWPLLFLILAVAFFLPAGWLVLRNVSKVRPGPVPASLRPIDEKTAIAGRVYRLGRRLASLERRITRHRKAAGALATDQSQLLARADSLLRELAELRVVIDGTAELRDKRRLLDSGEVVYDRAKEAVAAFTRSLNRPDLEADTLDEQELFKLLSQ